MRLMVAAGVSLLSAICSAEGYSVPHEHWVFMEGYKYDYPGCSVGWSGRAGSFLVVGDRCEEIGSSKMSADAMKSIVYVKKSSEAKSFAEYYDLSGRSSDRYSQSEANNDAVRIWLSGCSDFKQGMISRNFPKWLRLGEIEKSYPRLKKPAVVRLYMDGWDVSHGQGGVINCTEIAPYRSADFVSGIDIREAE